MGYKYWEEKEKVKDNEGEGYIGYIIGFVEIDNMGDKLDEATQNLRDSQKEYEDKKKSMKEQPANKKNTQLEKEYIDAGEKYRKAKDSAFRLENQYNVLEMNGDMTILIERLKDMYSRKENVAITILRNGINDGRIISTIKNISDSIHELDDYGVYLNAVYYDELKKIIQEEYYKMKPQDREFVDNNVPERVVTEYLKMCKERIDEAKDKITVKDECIYVPVGEFKNWHNESAFRSYKLADMKEALIIREICKHNKGRNDFNVKDIGKVICFYADKIEEIKE